MSYFVADFSDCRYSKVSASGDTIKSLLSLSLISGKKRLTHWVVFIAPSWGVQCVWNELSPEPGDINTLWHDHFASQETSQSVRPVSQPSWQQARQVGQSGSQTSRIQDAGWSVSVAVSQIKKQQGRESFRPVSQGAFHSVSTSRERQL